MIRDYVISKYAELLELPKEHALCVNLEKSTPHWAINRSTSLGDVAAADNYRAHESIQTQVSPDST